MSDSEENRIIERLNNKIVEVTKTSDKITEMSLESQDIAKNNNEKKQEMDFSNTGIDDVWDFVSPNRDLNNTTTTNGENREINNFDDAWDSVLDHYVEVKKDEVIQKEGEYNKSEPKIDETPIKTKPKKKKNKKTQIKQSNVYHDEDWNDGYDDYAQYDKYYDY